MIVWPECGGKEDNYLTIVQLMKDNTAYILLGFGYHEDVVLNFCERNGIKSPRNAASSWISDNGDRYSIVGAGFANVDFDNKELTLYGKSSTYSAGIDKRHADMISKSDSWNISITA